MGPVEEEEALDEVEVSRPPSSASTYSAMDGRELAPEIMSSGISESGLKPGRTSTASFFCSKKNEKQYTERV